MSSPRIRVVDAPPPTPPPKPRRVPWKIVLGVVGAAALLIGIRALIAGSGSRPQPPPESIPAPQATAAPPAPIPAPEPVVPIAPPVPAPVVPKPAPAPPPAVSKETVEAPKKADPLPIRDLVGHWSFDDGSGTEVADGSGSGNGGVLIGLGTRWIQGRVGGALGFDGKGGYVSCGLSSIPGPAETQTLAFWYRIDQAPAKEEVLISLTNDAQKSGVEAGLRDGKLVISGWGGTELVSAPLPTLNDWHHGAYTFDGTTHALHVDGKEAARSKAAPGTHPPSRLQFGRWTGGSKAYTGALDEVRLYGRVLSTAEIAALAAPAAPPEKPVDPVGTVDLLRLIDPARDSVQGMWSFAEGALVSPGVPWCRLQIPYAPPEEYDLTLVATRTANVESLNIGLVAGGRQFLALLDGWQGTRVGLELIDGKNAVDNETTAFRQVFKNGERATVVCAVRKESVRVTVDGNVLINWKADYRRMSLFPQWHVYSSEALLLGCYESVWRFDAITLRPVSGTGRSLVPAAQPPREPDHPPATSPGLAYDYYEGAWGNRLPNFASLQPVRRGKVEEFDLGPKGRPFLFAFRFTGYLRVPQDGEYTFYVASKDPSRLLIGSTEVVNNDYSHAFQEKRGAIRLKTGKHALAVEYASVTRGENLELRWEGPGIAKGPIPKDALFAPESPVPLKPGPPARSREERLEQFKKDVGSKDEPARVAALQSIRDLRDKAVRVLVARKLDSDTEAVRIAAAQTMGVQKHPEAAAALGRALLVNQKSEAVSKSILSALGDLGMCASLPALEAAVTLNNGVYGTEALAQISRIGCPEAAAGLLKHRRSAEDDYQKCIAAQSGTGARFAPTTPNPKYPLAHLYSPIVTTLYRLLGSSATPQEQEKSIKKGEHLQNLVATWFCEETEKTYDVTAGSPRCPHVPKSHADILLKHRKP